MRKKDALLIFIILMISVFILVLNEIINSGKSESIEIYVDDKLYKSISIDSEEEVTIKNNKGYNFIKIYDKGVEVVEASCPDKVCVNSGFIKSANEKIVCIPNKVLIKIKTINITNNKVDVISN